MFFVKVIQTSRLDIILRFNFFRLNLICAFEVKEHVKPADILIIFPIVYVSQQYYS